MTTPAAAPPPRPRVDKQVLAHAVQPHCPRRMALDATRHWTGAARDALRATGLPAPDPLARRIGARRSAGLEFQRDVYATLKTWFPRRYVEPCRSTPLARLLADPRDDWIATEVEWDGLALVDTLDVDWNARVRPDVVRARRHPSEREVTADGTLRPVDPADPRVGLQIIDVKRSPRVGPSHRAELAWYAWQLAARLAADRRDDRFYVRDDPAIWTTRPDAEADPDADPDARVDAHVTVEPLDAPLIQTRHLLEDALAAIVDIDLADWHERLGWHVGPDCIDCPYLGVRAWRDRADAAHCNGCLAEALASDRLCRIPGLGRAETEHLAQHGVHTTEALAALPPDAEALTSAPTLNAKADQILARAQALHADAPVPVRDALPGYRYRTAIDLYVEAHADPGNERAIALAWILSAFIWPAGSEHRPQRERREGVHVTRHRNDTAHLVTEALAAMDTAAKALEDTRALHGCKTPSTVQIHLWSPAESRRLARWLREVPPTRDDGPLARCLRHCLAGADHPEDPCDARDRGLHHVQSSLETRLAPGAHFAHTLAGVARALQAGAGQLPTVDEETFSDAIDLLWAQEMWNEGKQGKEKQRARARVEERATRRARMLARLTATALRGARRHTLASPGPRLGVDDTRVPHPFAADLADLLHDADAQGAHACNAHARSWLRPPAIRAATLDDIAITRITDPAERARALATLGLHEADPPLIVATTDPRCTHARIDAGEFALVLIPEGTTDIAHDPIHDHLPDAQAEFGTHVAAALEVRLVAFDRAARLVALHWSVFARARALRTLAWHHPLPGLAEWNDDAHPRAHLITWKTKTYTLRTLRHAAEVLGNPPVAQARRTHRATGAHAVAPTSTLAHALAWNPQSEHRVAADVPWPAHALTPTQDTVAARVATHAFTLVWGPPGAGKTATLAHGAHRLVERRRRANLPTRLLLAGPTWHAIRHLADAVRATLAAHAIPCASVDLKEPQANFHAYEQARTESVTLVTATGHQAAKLDAEWRNAYRVNAGFHGLVLDEASQVDTADWMRLIVTLARDACTVVAGDPLQLPPIRVRTPWPHPHLQGSVYDYLAAHEGVEAHVLDRSFRAPPALLDVVRAAGYPADFTSAVAPPAPDPDPDLPPRTDPACAVDAALAPDVVFAALAHADRTSTQRNEEETRWCVALARAARARHPQEDWHSFFTRRFGVVTPYRAQTQHVRDALARALAAPAPDVAEGVDTVERFQGRERDRIVVSLTAGHPDAIAAQEHHLLDPARLNVALSRARTHATLLTSRTLLAHVARGARAQRAQRYLAHVTYTLTRTALRLADGAELRVRTT